MTTRLKRLSLEQEIWRLVRDLTPSMQVVVLKDKKKIFEAQLGVEATYFDLASLTKPLFTVMALMKATKDRVCHPHERVIQWVPWFQNSKTTIANLLSHRAGLTWWKPYYQDGPRGIEEMWNFIGRDLQKNSKTSKLNVACEYSDLDFFMLKFILERIYQKPLLQIWNETSEAFYGESGLHFNPFNPQDLMVKKKTLFAYPKVLYAPTGLCSFTHRQRQGLVHDDNAWALGGVSTHAGLFGCLKDMAKVGFLLSALSEGRTSLLDIKTWKLFTHRAFVPRIGDWSYGFMMPSNGASSAGSFFSKVSIGHLGFTGTSFWFDPRSKVFIGILSNRVAKDSSRRFASLRGSIHDLLITRLQGRLT